VVLGAAVALALAGWARLPAAGASADAPPVVSQVSPASGPTAGSRQVTVTGSGFTHVKSVHFGSAAGSHIQVLSPRRLTVHTPAHAAGVVDVRVTTAAGTSARRHADLYTYVRPPRVTAVTPASGGTAGSSRITLSGAGFTKVRSVRFGTHPGIAVKVTSPTSLKVTTPPHAAGAVKVRVVTDFGTSAPVTFTYLDISLTDAAALALATRMFGDGAVRTLTVPADCGASPPVACPGGTPSNPLPTVSVDDAPQPLDTPRAEGSVSGNEFDIIGRFRLSTLQDVPITLPVIGNCGISIDTTHGSVPDITVAVPDSVVIDATTGVGADGPTVVGDATLTNLEQADYTVTGGGGCSTASIGSSTVIHIILGAITPWIHDVGTVCGAPDPDYVQACLG
jgi:hypothetical protein